jgi:hypothetical protein
MKRILLAACLLAAAVTAPAAWADTVRPEHRLTLGVIGDVPYGAAQVAEFRTDVAEINEDPTIERVIHLGDIKDGGSRCDTTYFQARLADFQAFDEPLVYTPGDNEWTDCHRASNGAFLPTERLDTIRQLFFAEPGQTLGRQRRTVRYQSEAFPENVRWNEARVTFGTVHVVGSNDDQLPWFGDRKDPVTGQPSPETRAERAERSREYTKRESAAVEWIDSIFDAAERRGARGVAIGMQADMWDASAPPAALTAFEPIKAILADRAESFGRPVLLLEGDSHKFLVETPEGMPANLKRVVVQGSSSTPREWLRLHVDPKSEQVFSCENVAYRTAAVSACPAPLAP